LKKLGFIFILLLFASANFFASDFYTIDDERKSPGDDKKAKAKREDTTKFEINPEILAEAEEIPDTTIITFPSHDLYETWDANSAHPYKFNEAFKSDSITLTLIAEGDSAFVLPYKGDLTSVFGWRRYRPHYGTDIKLNTGEPIKAAFDGMVRLAKYYYGYGNCVIIRHNNGLETVYAHLSKISVESGQVLNAGTVVGLGGNTGHSYGSHLHFEIRFLGQALDTQDFIDFEKGELKSNEFVLRKIDVENKYDLRALHNRHQHDLGLSKRGYAAVAKNGIYVIRKGDNLERIARRNGTNVKALCKKNGLKPTTVLRIGQKIKV
jgi:murein DD-endopeptidase MepM/ murein hydrolase activator NlpD